jgi:ubiquitin-protein ligase E3 B
MCLPRTRVCACALTLQSALRAQRVWRGRWHAERARAALLTAWNARFDAVQGPAEVRVACAPALGAAAPRRALTRRRKPLVASQLSGEDVRAALLPPLLLCARRRGGFTAVGVRGVGAARLARAFALLLGSLGAAAEASSYAGAAGAPGWARQAARVAALAAAVLAHPPGDAGVLPAVAARALCALCDAAAWRCLAASPSADAAAARAAAQAVLRAALAPAADALRALLTRRAAADAATRAGSDAVVMQLAQGILLRAATSADDAPAAAAGAAALASGVLAAPGALRAAPPALAAALRAPDALQAILRAMPAPPVSRDATASLWQLTHAALLGCSAAARCPPACAAALLEALRALTARGALAAARAAAPRHADVADALAALESPALLASMLSAAPAVRIDALAAFYWALLAPASSGAGSAAAIDADGDAPAPRAAMRALHALAFSPDLLPALWRHLAAALPAAAELPRPADDADAATMRAQAQSWAPRSLSGGISALRPALLPALGVFAASYDHLLFILDDDEFYESQRPFGLSQQRAIAAAMNALVVASHLSPGAPPPPRGDAGRALSAAARLLRALHARDARRGFCPPPLWLAPAAGAALEVAAAARALSQSGEEEDNAGTSGGPHALLRAAPHARPFDERVRVFRAACASDRAAAGAPAQPGGAADAASQQQQLQPTAPPITLTVRRSHLLEDSLSALGHRGGALRGRLIVRFVNAHGAPEAGIDQGGLFKELLTELIRDIFDPRRGLFLSTPEGLLYASPAASSAQEGRLLLRFAGLVVAKALYEGVLLELALAPFFVAALLRRPLSLDDLPALDADLHRSLLQLKRYEGDVADLCLDFTTGADDGMGGVSTVELLPGGAAVPVTRDNALAYVAAVADFRLCRQGAAGAAAFRAGLGALVPPPWLALFSPSELNALLSGGASDYDVADLEAHATLSGGYSASSRSVKLFYGVVAAFTPAQRAALLRFVTSCSRPPLGGFRHLHPPFCIHKVDCPSSGTFLAMLGGRDVARLPSASTCFNTLKLPNYRLASTLREKLLQAINSGSGFDLS